MHWRVADTSVQEICFRDVWPTCQWEKKRIIDVSGTRQATKKNIKHSQLTCQPHVKHQKESDCAVEAFYCWRVVDTSVVSKIEKPQPKNWKFIRWRVVHTSTLKGFCCIWHALTCRNTSIKSNWLQWRVKHTSALGKSWRLKAEGFWTEAACIYVII